MKDFEFTPKPWISKKMRGGIRIVSPNHPVKYTNGDIPIIASVPFHRHSLGLKYYEDDAEAIANGRLIENAPEMLGALCGIHDELINLARLQDWHSDIFKNKFYKVQSAIENATGLPIDEAIERWEATK